MQHGPAADPGASSTPIAGSYRDEGSDSVIHIGYDPGVGRWRVSETRRGADMGCEDYAAKDAVEDLMAAMLTEGYRRVD